MRAFHSCLKHCDCEPPDSVEAAFAGLERLTAELGFDRFAFGLRSPDRPPGSSPVVISNYPEEWLGRYLERRYEQIDPVTVTALRSVRPFLWDRGRFLRGFRKQQCRVLDEAGAFGLNSGLVVPLHGPGGAHALLSAVSRSERLTDGVRSAPERLLAVAAGTFDFMLAYSSGGDGSGAPGTELTVREQECLLWTAEGKTAQEIGDVLNLSVFTVNRHISTAVRKLGCANKAHAACTALSAGLIHIA